MLFSPVVALLIAADGLAVAAPQVCLLPVVVSTGPGPSYLKTVCGPDASSLKTEIDIVCEGTKDAAIMAYTFTCAASGKHFFTPAYDPEKAAKPPDSKTASIYPEPTTLEVDYAAADVIAQTIHSSMDSSGGPVRRNANAFAALGVAAMALILLC